MQKNPSVCARHHLWNSPPLEQVSKVAAVGTAAETGSDVLMEAACHIPLLSLPCTSFPLNEG